MNATTDQDEKSDAADQLFNVAAYSDDSGRVTGEIVDWGKTNTRKGTPDAYLEVQLPNGESFRETYDWPANDSDAYDFVRVVRQAGWSLSSIEQLPGSKVNCERVNGSWQVYLKPSLSDYAKQCLDTAGKEVAGAIVGVGVILGIYAGLLSAGLSILGAVSYGLLLLMYGFMGGTFAAVLALPVYERLGGETQ